MDAAIRHFEAFLAVARLGSFTRAAGVLHVSQPALTVQIRQLEHTLGLRLFDRTNRTVALTSAGRALVAPVERLLVDLDALLQHASDLSAHRRGLVTVAVLPSVAGGVLPTVIRALADRHHGIVVRVRDVVGERIVDLVRSGEVDFGIGSLMRPDAGMETERLFDDRLCAFVPAGHTLARRSFVALRDVVAHPLILTGRDSSVRQIVERALEQADLAATVAQEAAYMSTAIAMARAGLGIAILPESAADGPSASLRAVPIRPPSLTRQIAILRRRGQSISPAAGQVLALLKAHYA